MGFQIFFKRQSLFPIAKCDVGNKLPWFELGGVRRLTVVMCGKSFLEIFSVANIGSGWMLDASQ